MCVHLLNRSSSKQNKKTVMPPVKNNGIQRSSNTRNQRLGHTFQVNVSTQPTKKKRPADGAAFFWGPAWACCPPF
jgi:hypothetical protein